MKKFLIFCVVVFILAMLYIIFKTPIDNFVSNAIVTVRNWTPWEDTKEAVSTTDEKYERTVLGVIKELYSDGTIKVSASMGAVTVEVPYEVDYDSLTVGDKVRVDVISVYDKSTKALVRTVYRLRK